MARIIAVANLKGGAGKSTIAVNLACQLTTAGTVELVDADSQGTAAAWGAAGLLPVKVHTMPLDSAAGAQGWIARVLALKADYVVIDCPPHLNATAQAAVGIADLVLVPVTASGADIAATQRAVALIAEARVTRRQHGGKGPAALIVPSRIDRRTLVGREAPEALHGLGEKVGPSISQRTAFVDAFSSGEWIGDFAPDSPGHSEIRALAAAVRKGN